MSHGEDFEADELTGRTAKIAGLEIRVEAGEKANQETITLKRTVGTLKQIIAAAVAVGFFVNLGVWLNDKSHHYATKEKTAEHDAEIERIKLDMREQGTLMRSMIEAQKRTLDEVSDLNKYIRNNPRRGHER